MGLTVERGAMLAVLGPSGCGKSTTLRMIAGLVPPTSGRVLVDGRDITDAPRTAATWGGLPVVRALPAPGRRPQRGVRPGDAQGVQPELKRRVAEALDLVRLEHLAGRRIAQLSGGQQQRVALARALVVEPTVLLLDEPLSNLDAQLRGAMREEIRRIQRETGITTVFVTHDQHEALSMADRVAVMNQGRIEQAGTRRTCTSGRRAASSRSSSGARTCWRAGSSSAPDRARWWSCRAWAGWPRAARAPPRRAGPRRCCCDRTGSRSPPSRTARFRSRAPVPAGSRGARCCPPGTPARRSRTASAPGRTARSSTWSGRRAPPRRTAPVRRSRCPGTRRRRGSWPRPTARRTRGGGS
ncbi:ABC transporter ATP-binding protein [Streptomyces sp. M19]